MANFKGNGQQTANRIPPGPMEQESHPVPAQHRAQPPAEQKKHRDLSAGFAPVLGVVNVDLTTIQNIQGQVVMQLTDSVLEATKQYAGRKRIRVITRVWEED